MKRQKYKPYNLDITYEQKTYNHIGKDYGNRKTADKGIMRNFARWFRKWIYNRNEKHYKFCHTYGEWVEYLNSRDICIGADDRQDFLKYLMLRKRSAEIILEIEKVLVIPIYIAFFSILPSIYGMDKITLLHAVIILWMVVLLSICILYNASQEVYFLQDYIAYLEEEK